MLGRKKPPFDEGADAFLSANGSQDDLLHSGESRYGAEASANSHIQLPSLWNDE